MNKAEMKAKDLYLVKSTLNTTRMEIFDEVDWGRTPKLCTPLGCNSSVHPVVQQCSSKASAKRAPRQPPAQIICKTMGRKM
jgi:hypothetical protein